MSTSEGVRATMLRGVATAYELKYAVPEERMRAFLDATTPWLEHKIYDAARPVAYARTTYLDSEDRRYLASIKEPVFRRLRIREYGSAAGPDTPAVLHG